MICYYYENIVRNILFKGHGNILVTYSTRLKTVTRFPTGENRHVPSGLYSRLPWQ